MGVPEGVPHGRLGRRRVAGPDRVEHRPLDVDHGPGRVVAPDDAQGTAIQTIMAVAFMFTLPAVAFYLFAQKYVVSGMTAGAVKG